MAPRGALPGDEKRFGEGAIARLRAASEELAWLADRGYPKPFAMRVVGDHHQLDERQRTAVLRATCEPSKRRERDAKRLGPEQLAEGEVAIDGFNLLVSLEVALSGGPLLAGGDGALRDLAGLRGRYEPLPETDSAIEALAASLAWARCPSARIFIDAPVSHSGELRRRILEARWDIPIEVELVPSADRALKGLLRVASSDAAVIDASASWAPLSAWLALWLAPDAWVVHLAQDRSGRAVSTG